jgi:uncharacterized damage-inducible protein DinB
MPQIPQHTSQRVANDPRPIQPLVGDEREILTGYLDWQRQTFELKCQGLPPERLSERQIPPSTLTLHGLLRHLSGVERWWFRIQYAGEEVPMLYYTDEDPDQDFDALDGEVAEAFETWHTECDRSRQIVAEAPSLETTGTHLTTGNPVSLRRILVHMIGEYARHNGHADLIRERTDGTTGF